MSTISEATENGLYYRSWIPGGESKAVVMLIHGLGEHCQRYNALGQYLNDHAFTLCSMDLPHHGKSEGRRGHVDSFDVYQQAALALYKRTKEQHQGQAIFLLGHSMGGLIATQLLLNHQDKFQGALLSGAAIQSPQEPPAWQVVIIKGIASIMPKAQMLALDASCVSRDPAVVDNYMNDPLVSQDKLSAKFLVEMTQTMEQCKNGADKITLPLLVMHGGADVMTAPEGSKLLHQSVSSSDKQLEIYDGLFHEIFNEPEAKDIYATMVDWIDSRIPSP